MPEGSRQHVMLPSEFSMRNFTELKLKTADGVEIHAYHITNDQISKPKTTLLFLHANAGNMGHRYHFYPLMK